MAFLLDQGWIVPSSASHTASVMFARKARTGRGAPAGTTTASTPSRSDRWNLCCTSTSFTKLDLAIAYMQFRIREEDQHKASLCVPGSQYEFRMGAFGLRCMSSVLMRYMHSIFGRPSSFQTRLVGRCLSGAAGSTPPRPTLGRFKEVYCDAILILS